MKSPLEFLQPLARALMLPIAVLPVAGLLLRLGQADLLNLPFVAAAGDAIFSNLGLLFAIGVAVGFARENHGAAGLAGVVCFLVAVKGAQALLVAPPDAFAGLPAAAHDLAADAWRNHATDKLGVPLGILSGLIGGLFYNRFSTIALPEYLAFFGGRRFVPIVSGLAGLGLAVVFGLAFGAISGGVDGLSRMIVGSGEVGLFLFGLFNRLLIVTGLHHILNNIVWFVVGDYHGATGDLHRFFAGDPTAGAFMSGYFPIMMFGLPAACLAMYHAAPPERRKAVGGMFVSLALTSFLTGVTEPIEFTFMFLAPALFLLHAVLTGAAMVTMDLLGVKMGFGFSAGLFDYVLNFGRATRPLLLAPVGAATFALYYGLFRLAIRRFDLKTPGREAEGEAAALVAPATAPGGRGEAFLEALGGSVNVVSVDACTTRLRLIVRDQATADEARLRALGARGLVRPSATVLQVVLGPVADQVAGEIQTALGARLAAPPVARTVGAPPSAVPPMDPDRARALLAALGGRGNIEAVAALGGRLRIDLTDPSAIDEAALGAVGGRGLARVGGGRVHVLLGPDAAAAGAALAR